MSLMLQIASITTAARRISQDVDKLAAQAIAYVAISTRNDEAREYCQKYLMPNAWGENVWHAILDDAQKLRQEKEKRHESV